MRPYNAVIHAFKSLDQYQRLHKRIFGQNDIINDGVEGRMCGGVLDGQATYLVWYSSTHTLAHELSHCVLDRFQRIGIDPREAGGEPFCYMLSQLMLEASP